MAEDLYTNLPRRILEILKDGMGVGSNGFKTYWDGDPIMIASSLLPACIVDWQTVDPLPNPTGLDRWQHQIVIKLVVSKMDDAGAIGVKSQGVLRETPTKKRLERWVFGRSATTGQYMPNTVFGILRTNFTADSSEIDQALRVEFGNSQRPGDNAQTMVTSEVHITLTAKETIQVPVRR